MIIYIWILSFVASEVTSYEDCSAKRLTNYFWSDDQKSCLPCTNCHDQRLITLIGCAPDKDAVCGTIEDLRHQWLLPSLRNGKDISSPSFVAKKSEKDSSSTEVYGRTRYGPPKSNDHRRYDATHQVKESIRNASQKKNEFLRKLQELEQISVGQKVRKEQDEVEGTVHFAEDGFFRPAADGDELHQDLEIIEKELLQEKQSSKSSQGTSMTTSESMTSSTKSIHIDMTTTTSEATTTAPKTSSAPPIPIWFNGNQGVLETQDGYISSTMASIEDDYVGQEHFFATGRYVGNEPDVFGAVLQEPRDAGRDEEEHGQHHQADEFGLLKQILYKEPAQKEKAGKATLTNEKASSYIAVKLEHVLVIVGFCIGFGFVFCVALIYQKVKPWQRFNMLNNQTVGSGDASSMSSGNSSFQQTDSRLTSLTASPLLSQAQSPCVVRVANGGGLSPVAASQMTSPIISRDDVSPSVLNIPNGGRHSVYVDQRGRTSLKQSRELPV